MDKIESKQHDNSKGKCPNCGSENLKWGDRFDEDEVGFQFTCEDCGTHGIEWYSLEYANTIYATD